MARATINEHPDRGRIEFDLARGVPVRAVAKKYCVNIHACYRLLKKLPPQLRAAHMGARLKAGADLERLRLDESEALLQNIATQRARLLLMQDSAMDAGDHNTAALLAGRILQSIELAGKYLGEFAQHQIRTTVSVLISPEYLEFRAALIRALASYPDARRAVALALHAIEAKSATAGPATISPKHELQSPMDGTMLEHEASHAR
jgi:hypothetical protein